MATQIVRTELMRILSAISKVVEVRNTIPLLSNVVLAASEGKLTVRGTDLDIEATGVVDADGDLDLTAVPGRDLDAIVRRLVGEKVTLEQDGDQLVVSSGRSRFKLPTLDGSTYPTLGAVDTAIEFSANLRGLVEQVSFAAGAHSQHAMLIGTFLTVEAGQLVAVATDGKRMARAVGDAVGVALPGVILPPKLLPHIPAGVVDVAVSTNRIALSTDTLTIASKLIEATYPNYKRLWPTTYDTSVVVDRRELKAAAERVALVSDENTGRGVKFTANSGAVTLTVRSHVRGEAVEEVAAEYGGPERDWGFNATSLVEMLGQVSGDQLTISMAKVGADLRGAEGMAGVLTYFELGSAA